MSTNKNLIDTLKDIMSWVRDNLLKLKDNLSKEIVAESDSWEVKDAGGNVIFKVDESGVHTTALELREYDSPEEKWTIQDESGNIIARLNKDGLQVTKINAKQLYINGQQIDESGFVIPNAEDESF